MTPGEFLRAIWPGEGIYCLATPFTIPGTTVRTYAHKTFDTIDGALSFISRERGARDLFFAIHTLKVAQVWNPEKTNRKTGDVGAFEVRTQANSLAAKCFFFDIDVGAAEGKYASQDEAATALIAFCKVTKLPRPLVTSSGGGLHVYWLVSDMLLSGDWRVHAAKLRQLARHYGLKADPSRTTDTASVLRVVGTFNMKDRFNPREVKALMLANPTPTGLFTKALDDALIVAGLEAKAPLVFTAPGADTLLGSNTELEYDGPPVAIAAVLSACAQIRRVALLGGNVPEPEWYQALNVVRFVEDGAKLVHKLSSKHPTYNASETDAKVAQLEAKGIKPSSCMKIAEVAGDELCEGCPFAGKVKNPLMAARFKDSAPRPVVQTLVGAVVIDTVIPAPPKPFTRMKGGGISVCAVNKDGDEVHTIIYDYDLHPMRRLANTASETEQQVWRVELPLGETKEFTLDADALYDTRKFIHGITNQGLYPHKANLPYLQEYMVAYITELQRLTNADAQCNHLGWTAEQATFILPDKILQRDGSAKGASLSAGAARSSAYVHRRGDAARQIELMRFFEHPLYTANQFMILASLAAPIFIATGHHGVIVNASGDAGASKSTTLYTGASLWGQPELYPINGTNNGATVRGRNERITVLANLPICVDEITHMPIRDAVDLAMSITQPGHRIRLDTSGTERSATGSYKATIMLSTANNSLHSLLSTDNSAGTAGSMRVFEIRFVNTHVHQKHEADDFLHELKQNYGHLGELFIGYVIQHYDAVVARVRAMTKEIDIAANIQGSERFWSAVIAVVLVTGEIAHELGLLNYHVPSIRHWALTRQIPTMRGIVVEEYSDPLAILANYMESINGEIIMVSKLKHAGGNLTNVLKPPSRAMLAHYDTSEQVMWVLKKGFRDYCIRVGANAAKVIEDLCAGRPDDTGRRSPIVSHKHIRKVLGAGTDYAKAQSWCFVVNMAHPEVAGEQLLKGDGTNRPPLTVVQ